MAGITYVCLPFCYAASYTWHLLHPHCEEKTVEGIKAEWVQLEEDNAGVFPFWYVPAENGRVIILVGGRGGTVSDWQPEVDMLVAHGYGVAVLADPGCYLPTSTLGVREKEQITALADYLTEDEQVAWIGAAGFSAGASTLALAVSQTDQLQAVVLMGNFADLQSEIMYTPYKVGSIGWLGQHAVPFWYWAFTGVHVKELSPIQAYEDYADINVFLIHGDYEAQRTSARKQVDVLQHNGIVNAELWVVPGAYHGTYYNAAGEVYLEKLVSFFDGVDG